MKMYCPNANCINHHPKTETRWYIKKGFQHNPPHCYQIYQCKNCGKKFSERTFSIDFYTHQKIDYDVLKKELQSGSSMRAISRKLNCTTKVIQNRISRLARNIMGFNSDLISTQTLHENLVADGIVNFVNSQYFPVEFNLLIGSYSNLVYGLTYSHTRRRGTTTDKQKKAMPAKYKGVDFKTYSITNGFKMLMDTAGKLVKKSDKNQVKLFTDMKKEYQIALKQNKLSNQLLEEKRLSHLTTNSKAPRTAKNPLAPANYMDREMRKDLAGFHRETVCQARNIINCIERLIVYFFYHNVDKKYKINTPKSENGVKHIDKADFRPKNFAEMKEFVYSGRRLFSDVKKQLSNFEKLVWRKKIPTPGKSNVNYIPGFALS